MKVRPGYIFIECKYSYPPTLKEVELALKDWARLGFSRIELEGVTPEHLKEIEENKVWIKNLCNRYELSVSNFIVILPHIPSLSYEDKALVMDLFDQAVRIADYFECETLDLDSFTPTRVRFPHGIPYLQTSPTCVPCRVEIPTGFSWEAQWESFVDTISKCNQKARKAGIRLEIHPRTYEIIGNTDGFLRLADAVNDGNLGVILDTAHLHVQKEILPLSIHKLAGKIWSVHASDSDGCRMEHLPIGTGSIDWPELLRALKSVGFSGEFVVDIGGEPHTLDLAYEYSRKALEYFAQQSGTN